MKALRKTLKTMRKTLVNQKMTSLQNINIMHIMSICFYLFISQEKFVLSSIRKTEKNQDRYLDIQ